MVESLKSKLMTIARIRTRGILLNQGIGVGIVVGRGPRIDTALSGIAFGIMFTALGLMAAERKAKKVNKNRRRGFRPATS